MTEHFPHQTPALLALPRAVKDDQPPAPLETVARHLELVHRVQVLHVAFDARAVRRARQPEVKVFMSACLKVERVVARVQVGELIQQVEGRLVVQLGVCAVSQRDPMV